MTATRTRRTKPTATATADTAPEAEAIRVGEIVHEIDRSLLHPGQYQNRDIFEPVRLAELAESIRESGIKLPLIVRPDPAQPGTYQIVAGERRWRASESAGLTTVPCLVRDLSDADHALTTALENLQRVDLTPIEEARDFRTLRDVAGYDIPTTSLKTGVAADFIKDSLRLLDLPERTQALIHHGAWSAPEGDPERKVLRLSRAQGLALAAIQKDENPGLTDLLAELALVNGISAQRIASPQSRRDMLYADAARVGLLPNGQPDPEKARIVKLPQAKWLDTNCHRCPYACFEGSTDYYGAKYCLKPEHYFIVVERERVKEEAATETRRQQAEAALAQALAAKEAGLTNASLPAADETAPDGTPPAPPALTIPDLRTLAPGSYVELVGTELKDKAAACSDDCPCRAMAKNFAGALVPICADPGRFRKLKAAQTRSVNKDRRKEAKALMTRLAGDIDTAAATPAGFTERELRLIALAALDGITSGTKNLTSAGRHVIPYLGQTSLFENVAGPSGINPSYSPNLLRKIGEAKLAAVPTAALVRFAAESLALKDLYDYHEYGWEGKHMKAYRRDGDDEGAEATASLDPAVSGEATPTPARPPYPQPAVAERRHSDPVTWSSGGDDAPPDLAARAPELPEAAPAAEPDPDVALAYGRNDWAYEVLAQNDRDVAAFIVLHRTEGGDLIAINQDADYLAQAFACDLEPIPGQPDAIAARVAARDAGRIIGQIGDEHGYFVAVIPHEGATIEEFTGDEAGDDDGEGDEESYYEGPDLEDRLAALEQIATT